MIRLLKGTAPNVLLANREKWTKELTDAINSGQDPTPTQVGHYRHKDIKTALEAETHKKCAYCESKPYHVTFGDIEHVTPRISQPERAFDWDNLTLACDRCNTYKSSHQGLVDPYIDDPELAFMFEGSLIFARPAQQVAERTVSILKLNRPDLYERRGERLQTLVQQLYRLSETTDPQQRDFLRNALIAEETSGDKEYSACVRAFVQSMRAQGYL